MPGRPNLRQAHLCHSVVSAASCAGRVARGRDHRVAAAATVGGGAGEWQHGPAPRRLPPYACVPLGVRPRLPGRPNLRQAHLCHSAVPAASCAGRVARGTSGTVRRRRRHGWRRRRASGSTALLPDACRHMPVSLLGCALACQDGQTCARPTCAIQLSQLHRAQAVLRVALVALGGGGDAVGGWGGRVAARPCSQTPAAICLCPSWDAPSLARTAKLAPGPPVPFSGPSRIVRRPCCAWH